MWRGKPEHVWDFCKRKTISHSKEEESIMLIRFLLKKCYWKKIKLGYNLTFKKISQKDIAWQKYNLKPHEISNFVMKNKAFSSRKEHFKSSI